MEPTSLVDEAEFRLPPEFLTEDDFLVEKVFKGDESNLFPYELSHGFGSDSGLASTGDEESFLTGFTRKTVRSAHEDDFSGGFYRNHAFPAGKACGTTTRIGCGRRNQNSQAAAWDLYSAAVEDLAMMNINDESYGYNSGRRGVVDPPRKHPIAAAKIPNDVSGGYYSRQSLQYRKLQALHFQQLKQQQLMKQLVQQSRGLKPNNNNKVAGHVDLPPSAWSNQPQRRDGSGMRAVFLGDRTGKKTRSTGTGVFLPRRVDHDLETREKSSIATVLIPARVAEVLNLDESVVQPSVRSPASLINDVSWRQRSNNGRFSSQMKMEQTVNEPRLPSDWAY